MSSASLTAVANEGRRDPGRRLSASPRRTSPDIKIVSIEILSGEIDTIRHEHLRVETQIVSH